MIKLVGFPRRKPGLSAAEFRHHWKEVHYPLVMGLGEFTGLVRRYVQSHALDEQLAVPGTAAPIDGVVEIWFDNLDDLKRAFSLPVYREVVRPDELKFLDLPNCVSLVVRDVLRMEQPA